MVEHLAVLAGQAEVVGVAGSRQVADRRFAAHGAVEPVEPEGIKGSEVETVPWLDREVLGRRLQPVGVLGILFRQLGEPAINVLCALPL